MKIVILDHPDWLELKLAKKVIPVFDTGKCAAALHMHPDTRHWRFALICFTTLIPLGVALGIVLLFFVWWLGLLLILFSLFPLRKGLSDSIHQEVIRVAEKNPSFFSCAIATGGLRFRVRPEDLEGRQYLDGHMDVPFFMPNFE